MEIQLQIFDNPDPIVTDDRYFIYNRICQVKLSGHLGKKYKHIHLYIFNDGLLWCSKRGQFKKGFKFINTNLLYGVHEDNNSEDATMFIQYGSRHKNKKRKNNKKNKNKPKNIYSPHPQSIMNESKENLEIQQTEEEEQDYSMQINHGKPTKKTILVFVNEQARDQCLQKIKQTQTKYLKRLQRQLLKRKERQKLKKGKPSKNGHNNNHPLNIKNKNKNKLNIHDINNESSLTLSQTEESSLYQQLSSMENSSGLSSMKYDHMLSLKPLESHKQYSNTFSTTINSSAITSNILDSNEQSDDTDNNMMNNIIVVGIDDNIKNNDNESDDNILDIEHSKSTSTGNKSQHSNNSSININITPIPNCKPLKQSVSKEITTIKEEDEDDVNHEKL